LRWQRSDFAISLPHLTAIHAEGRATALSDQASENFDATMCVLIAG
jgi:hypothetical protein